MSPLAMVIVAVFASASITFHPSRVSPTFR